MLPAKESQPEAPSELTTAEPWTASFTRTGVDLLGLAAEDTAEDLFELTTRFSTSSNNSSAKSSAGAGARRIKSRKTDLMAIHFLVILSSVPINPGKADETDYPAKPG
jgi:hypothetical protein